MKVLCDHQTGYLPWLGLFHRMSLSDLYLTLDTVLYTRRSWDDRNKIVTPQGWMWLKVPTKKESSRIFKDIHIDNSADWKRKHLFSIRHFYSKTPFFDQLYPRMEEVLSRDWVRLVDLNEHLLKFFCRWMGIDITFHRASDVAIFGEKNLYLVNLCRAFRADAYLFGQMGRHYADVDLFEKNGICVRIHDYRHPVYPQKNPVQQEAFVPYLSILDLLFNVGRERALSVITEGNATREAVFS